MHWCPLDNGPLTRWDPNQWIQVLCVWVWVFSAHSCCPAGLGISPSPSGAPAPQADPETPQTPAPSSRCYTCLPLSSARPGSTSRPPYAGNSTTWQGREKLELILWYEVLSNRVFWSVDVIRIAKGFFFETFLPIKWNTRRSICRTNQLQLCCLAAQYWKQTAFVLLKLCKPSEGKQDTIWCWWV